MQKYNKKIIIYFGIFIVFFCLFVSSTQIANAAGLESVIPCLKPDSNDPVKNGLSGLNCNSWQDLLDVAQLFINSALIFATFLATLSFTYAGWLYLTSNGDTSRVQKAHDIFKMVLMGFIYIAAAFLLIKLILTTIAKPDYSKLQ